MFKLTIPPDNSSYATTEGDSVVSVQLAGGTARYRKDVLGATSTVDVQWITSKSGYDYLKAFYKGASDCGALPFQIDLILDSSELTTHKAYFKKGTFRLIQQEGLTYICVASLEVAPLPISSEDYTDIVVMYNEAGENWNIYESLFNDIINTDLPEIL